jgi:hypothetical protein
VEYEKENGEGYKRRMSYGYKNIDLKRNKRMCRDGEPFG